PAVALVPEHTLEVEVTLPTSDASTYPDWPITEVPHGKQSWYGPIGGIWQSVELEARDPCHIRQVGIRADLTGNVLAEVLLSAEAPDTVVRMEVVDSDGRLAATNEQATAGRRVLLALKVDRPSPWSPDSP